LGSFEYILSNTIRLACELCNFFKEVLLEIIALEYIQKAKSFPLAVTYTIQGFHYKRIFRDIA
jgi:hypothetical protein